MKKTVCFLLIVAFMLSLGSCAPRTPIRDEAANPEHLYIGDDLPQEPDAPVTDPEPDQSGTPDTQTPEPAEPNQPGTTPQPEPNTPPASQTPADYSTISCRRVTAWKPLRLKDNYSELKIQLEVPKDWTFTKKDNCTYNIACNGKEIGTLSTQPFEDPEDTAEFSSHKDLDNYIMVYRQINRHGNDYYRYFELDSERDDNRLVVYWQVQYDQLDEIGAQRMQTGAVTVSKAENFPTLAQTNKAKKLLIIGNSFVNTSKIGSFLRDMLSEGGKNYAVDAVSVGMASIEDVAADNSRMAKIRNGEYCFVFLCGFYSTVDDAECYGDVEDACQSSNTALIAFPAHNESRNSLSTVEMEHPDFQILDWKGELDSLIDSGVNRWDLCYDDTYDHSTPLAGYVGAHMIYRTLFRQVPPATTDASPLAFNKIQEKLGSYVKKDGKVIPYTGEELTF